MAKKPVAKNSEAEVVEKILKGIGSIFAGLFRLIFKRGKATNPEFEAGRAKLIEAWEMVELHLVENRGSLAISEADKIADAALRLIGVRGETMGDRLKNAESHFDSNLYNRLWEAHKLRNKLAHEVGYEVSVSKAREAVSAFRDTLSRLNIF